MKVAVLVDDLDPDRRRRSFWEEQLSELPDLQFELVSLLKDMEERRFFNVYAYDLVIFNWCVLDGALMYASDRVQQIVSFYDDHFFQYVRRGGVVIMENQPKRWRPVQKAYDLLFPGQLRVVSRDTHFYGDAVLVNPRLRKHPLVAHLPRRLDSAYAHSPEESWFPEASTSARSLQELHPTKVYSGAFRRWTSEWLPLLYTVDERLPTMVVKTDGLGLWIVTTMYLASANIKDLIESLVHGSRRHALAIRHFHERAAIRRRWRILQLAALFVLIGVISYAVLTSEVVTADVPYGDTLAGNVGLSILFATAAAIGAAVRKLVWNSIRELFNR